MLNNDFFFHPVKYCLDALVEVLVILMVHPSYVAKVKFEHEMANEDYFANLERKILESCQKILPQTSNLNAKPILKEKVKPNKRIVLCDILKTNVKDVIIQQCGIVLDDLAKNVQLVDNFDTVLNHCKLVLTFLDVS